ncbi:radical SAM protein [Luteibacter anthropi]|uniref:radical SAM protein n=1 Tax=Luteibacter anthropi TaxID=564369 RepID=UPI002032ED22|nr:radical SAM protein [Luteibacter anthropi]URX61738.1 radical SAM protein [Luteibacter anthropi]
MRINALYVIVKLVERCNLKCSYCYYYTADNAEVYERPALMASGHLDDLLTFVEQARRDTPFPRVVFGFHGGEPTLAKAAHVRRFCLEARRRLEPELSVGFSLQTNGVHLSDDWLALLAEQRMGVGISIDGPKDIHDRYRMDHRDRGSHDRVRHTLSRLLPLDEGGLIHLTALAVMGDDFSGVPSYRHLVEDLGVRRIKLLFVDRTADEPWSGADQDRLASFLCDTFDYWLTHHRDSVEVIFFETVIRGLLAARHGIRGDRSRITLGFALLSDGRIRIQDDFMVATDWFWSQRDLAIAHATLDDYLGQPHLEALVGSLIEAPAACAGCVYADSCAGGEVAHRYTRARGFENRSVYCQALTAFYRHVDERLLGGEARLREDRADVDDGVLVA